jgi:arachidonate 15-lipoxygenase
MTAKASLLWEIRKRFWSRWQVFRFWVAGPKRIGQPPVTDAPIGLKPFAKLYPRIPMKKVMVFDELPNKRAALGMRILVGLGIWIERYLFSQMEKDAPEINEDPLTALNEGLLSMHINAFRAPRRPPVFRTEEAPDLGILAMQTPLTVFLERASEGELMWDFSFLGKYEHQEGLRSIGVKVLFSDPMEGASPRSPETADYEYGMILPGDERWEDSNQPRPLKIISDEYGEVLPGEECWEDSVLLAICAGMTHLALTRHFNYVHLISGNHWEVAARNCLAIGDPVYHLIWPQVFDSCYTNYGVTRVQMLPEGDFVNMFSFTHRGLMDYFDEMYELYDWQVMDPVADWARRGLDHIQPDPDYWLFQHNLQELFGVMRTHADRHIRHYYKDDESLQEDKAVRGWLTHLHDIVPGGIGEELVENPTREALARLIGAYIYEGNSVHEMAGTHLWDYQLWADKCPTRIYRNGQRVPVDVYQRVINNNFALQLERAPMLDNYRGSAMDEAGRGLFTRFTIDCRSLQASYDVARWSCPYNEDEAPWRMEPRNMTISMNG